MTRRSVQAVRHIAFENLGSFETPLREAGYDIEYIDVAERDPTTLDPLDADLLVVLGGPIGVYDDGAYPFITGEVELLKARLAADRPTLGICLGAQLMAAALGARIYPGPAKGDRLVRARSKTNQSRQSSCRASRHTRASLAWRHLRSAGRHHPARFHRTEP